jgi:hypothetical protein
MKLPVLPTYYYLDQFMEMLSFVATTYALILDETTTYSSASSSV